MALGDLLYRGASAWLRLVGHTATTRAVLTQTGTGSASAAPAWVALSISEVEVAISSSDLLGIRATPKQLVAAPGAGKVVEFVGGVLLLDATATAYVESNDNLAVKYTNGSGVQVSETIEMTGFIDQTTDQFTNIQPAVNTIVAKAGCENQALVLHGIGDGEFTTGTGVVRAKIAYRVWATGW